MWNTITWEFFEGWPNNGPTPKQKELIDIFINTERFKNMSEMYMQHEVNNITYESYLNTSEVNFLLYSMIIVSKCARLKMNFYRL